MTTATRPPEQDQAPDGLEVLETAAARGLSLPAKLAGTAVGLSLLGLLALVMIVAAISRPSQQSQGTAVYGVSAYALADIPPHYLQLYQSAATADGIDWAVLAGIGKVETDHGRSNLAGVKSGANFLGCCGGPMQFFFVPFGGRIAAASKNASTWGQYGVDGDSDGYKDVWDPDDAIPAAADYLKASGAPGDYRAAVWAYNHSTAYYDEVMSYADRYRGQLTGGAPALTGDKLSQLVQAADALEAQRLPYCYGGGHGSTPATPSSGTYCWGGSPLHKIYGSSDKGLDCSSSVSLLLQEIGYQLPTMTSGSLASWGLPGPGAAVTIWANADHVFLEIHVNGQVRMFGTSYSNYRHGPGWHPVRSTAGFVARHPEGL
ncbi:MAG: lytic transglycosylase domain-containing protein [Patulibacter sp.]|nr:lytic transglycosylase domain-containing protein [Patulibacter sp.]